MKPCPFCGGEGKLWETNLWDKKRDHSEWVVTCQKCGAERDDAYSREKAIEEWNERYGGVK